MTKFNRLFIIIYGAFMSLNGMVIKLKQTLGPMLIGIGYSISGLNGAYYLGAFMALLGLIVSFTMINENKILTKAD